MFIVVSLFFALSSQNVFLFVPFQSLLRLILSLINFSCKMADLFFIHHTVSQCLVAINQLE